MDIKARIRALEREIAGLESALARVPSRWGLSGKNSVQQQAGCAFADNPISALETTTARILHVDDNGDPVDTGSSIVVGDYLDVIPPGVTLSEEAVLFWQEDETNRSMKILDGFRCRDMGGSSSA